MPIDLSALNPEQYEATMCTDGPLLLLAGAGTGKTRVLTYRIAHMVEDLHVSPYQILAVTFTNKAATEMRVRLAGLVPGGIRGMWVSTFHAACVRMLRQNAEAIGYTRNFTIYDDDDSKRLMREIYATLNISPKQYAPNALRSRISSAKNDLEEPSELAELAENAYDRVAARAYAALQDRLRRADAMDFDDLLFNAVRLLRDNKHVLNDYQERFRYILIDEYQDTNKAQYAISNMLASKYRNIMVVGDDDQSIYSWRGADIRNILEFENDYPDATVLKLERNYRSTATILNAANAVVSHNAQRKDKHLFTDGDKGNKIAVYQASDERDEGRWIAGEIEKLHRRGRSYADIAVFYRTNAQSRVLEDMMLRAGVPYRIVGGTRFFDRAEIRDVMAYLKIIVNPADDVSAKRVVNTPRRGIGKTTIEKLEGITRRDECTFLEACELAIADAELIAQGARNSLAKFVQMIKDARQFDGQLRDVVELIVERSGLIEALKAEHSEEAEGRIENIQEFYGVVQEYDETHEDVFEDDSIDAISETTANAQLPLFMEWLALRTDLDSLADDDAAITLMTVHSAKGLEFPVVFISGLEETVFPHVAAFEEENGIEEERRLAYVAITRARELLYLTHTQVRSLYGATHVNPPSRFIHEIPTECMTLSGVGSAGFGGTGWEKRGDRHGMFGSGSDKETGRLFGSGAGSSGFGTGGGAGGAHKREAVEKFATGDLVDHKTFGRGRVISVNGDKLHIRFERSGEKDLLAGYAPIVKIK